MTCAPQAGHSRLGDALLAKLVICCGAVIALATSAPPTWQVEDEQVMRVALDDANTRRLLLTVELGGPLYADASSGWVQLTLSTDRAASDLTFRVERLEGSGDGSTSSASDAGVEGGLVELPWVADFSPEAPARAFHSVQLACPPSDLGPRQETCIDQLAITLARTSARPLHAELTIHTTIVGQREKRPRGGSFAVSLEEVAP